MAQHDDGWSHGDMLSQAPAAADRSVPSFGELLREWRERRRLSQLELALQAGTTQRHLSFIERGKSTPGRAIVVRLAESMALPLRDRNLLLLSAGYAALFPETPLGSDSLAGARASLQRVLDGHEPFPAIVTGVSGELLVSNAAVHVLSEGVHPDLLRRPINALRLALHPDGMAPRVTNFDQWAPHIIHTLRREERLNPDERRSQILAELETYVPDTTPAADYIGFTVPLRLRTHHAELSFLNTLSYFPLAHDITLSELRLEAFLPADEATSAVLYRLADERRARGADTRIAFREPVTS